MDDVDTCWNNSGVECLFGSLKHDWIFKVVQPTREHMTQDVAAYVLQPGKVFSNGYVASGV